MFIKTLNGRPIKTLNAVRTYRNKYCAVHAETAFSTAGTEC
jgi:hypothetical protein